MASLQHGLTSMNATRPKSKLYKRNNKAKARGRKEQLLKALDEAVKSAKGIKTTTPKKAESKPKTAKKVVDIKTAKKTVKEPTIAKQEEKIAA